MLFGACWLNALIQIYIDGVNIERVNEIKFLGITIDNKISWKWHINHVHSKISRSIAVLNKAKQVLDTKSLHILYCFLVLPYLTYCSEVWGNNYKTSFHSLITLQKRAIQITHKAGYRDLTNALFFESKLLQFTDLEEF